MTDNACPECRQDLSEQSNCSCGWRVIHPKQTEIPDYRCYYALEKQRCANGGTISTSVKSNAVWLCRPHWDARHHLERSREILEQQKQ